MMVPFSKKWLDISILLGWAKTSFLSAYSFISEPMSTLANIINLDYCWKVRKAFPEILWFFNIAMNKAKETSILIFSKSLSSVSGIL